jgi:UDP-N-acetylmuramyl pentapeptide phosphotransferase/UDP-N-acetylglucosamine-1-phosphate transferase
MPAPVTLIWIAGGIHLAIVLVNATLPGKLRVREGMKSTPPFFRQIFYVHWIYIVMVLALFTALCFGFAPDLAGASPLGRFLSSFIAAFWLLRIFLQWLYYDSEVRRQNRFLDSLYLLALMALVAIFGFVALRPTLGAG